LRPALLRKCSHAHWNQREFPKSYISGLCDNWCVFVKYLLSSGISLHTKDVDGRAPLLFAIKKILDFESLGHSLFSDIEAAANTVLRIWIEALNVAGMDIQKYGAEERLLYSTGKVNKNIQISVCFYYKETHGSKIISFEWRVISLECGASVEDWHIRDSEPTDKYAGQFWKMIDYPEWKLPGA